MTQELHVVTGALGFSGRYITEELLARGHRVRTLTNSPGRPNPFGDKLEIASLSFGDPGSLVRSLDGAKVLYNTYWVRFNHKDFTHEDAVRNTFILFLAAMRAGVERIVHVSITNPTEDSPLEYFQGKARIERMLVETGMAHTILRPAVLFGPEDILVNNIAWGLRSFPLVFLFGRGNYGIRPIHARDLAWLAVREGGLSGNRMINAVGPDRFTFRELVQEVGKALNIRKPLMGLPPRIALGMAGIVGLIKRDVFLTWDEIRGLMDGLLDVPDEGADKELLDRGISLKAWAREHRQSLGLSYASELGRRRDRKSSYSARK